MDSDSKPVVGNWYERADDGELFVVLAIDEDRNVVEVRYEDGELDELDLDDWPDLELEAADPPEGWEDDEEEPASEPEDEAGGTKRRPGETWEDDEEDDEDDYEDDWGEEKEDY